MGRLEAARRMIPARWPSRWAIRGARASAAAVAQHEDPIRVDSRKTPRLVEGRHHIVENLFLDGDGLVQALLQELFLLGERPLVVAEHGDPPRGQAMGQVAERRVRSQRLVAIVGARAMNQDHQGSRCDALGPRERPGQRPVAGADGDRFLGELALLGIGRLGGVGRLLGGNEEEPLDLPLRVEADQGIERRGLEVAADLHPGRALRPCRSAAVPSSRSDQAAVASCFQSSSSLAGPRTSFILASKFAVASVNFPA